MTNLQTGSEMNPGAPNRETDIAYQSGQVAALIGKGWHQLEKDSCARVKNRCKTRVQIHVANNLN